MNSPKEQVNERPRQSAYDGTISVTQLSGVRWGLTDLESREVVSIPNASNNFWSEIRRDADYGAPDRIYSRVQNDLDAYYSRSFRTPTEPYFSPESLRTIGEIVAVAKRNAFKNQMRGLLDADHLLCFDYREAVTHDALELGVVLHTEVLEAIDRAQEKIKK